MLILVAAFLASLLPSIALFLWLRKVEGDDTFTAICDKALIRGLTCIIPVIGISGALWVASLLLRFAGLSGVAYAAFYTIVTLAFAEELSKYLWFRTFLAKYARAWSWMDYIILMTLVGIGFGLAEDVPYAIGTNPIQMLVRGVTIMHGGYGFVMGYFMGKAEKTGNKLWAVVGFGLPWALHGLFDFGLSDELVAYGEGWMFLSLSLAVLAVITLVVLIVFVLRHKADPRYREPMLSVPVQAPPVEQAGSVEAASSQEYRARHFE